MRLEVTFLGASCADSQIVIHGKSALAGLLYWADERGPLPGWAPLAAVPLSPAGRTVYRFGGHRAVPPRATHIFLRCVSQDLLSTEESLAEIPVQNRRAEALDEPIARFSVLSDLHMAARTGRIHRALRMAESDLLITGDLTNDGDPEQFARLLCCLEDAAPERAVFAVTGNHDQPVNAAADAAGPAFLLKLLQRAQDTGYRIHAETAGAYSAIRGGVDIIGLPCAAPGRVFRFPQAAQLQWLAAHLEEQADARWHILLCHAPLLQHNPHRSSGPPYLAHDAELQRIIQRHKNILFLSGHTHCSPNGSRGNVEIQPDARTVYLDAGSVVAPELCGEALAPAVWKDGVVFSLALYPNEIEIRSRAIHSGLFYPRGYYRASWDA